MAKTTKINAPKIYKETLEILEASPDPQFRVLVVCETLGQMVKLVSQMSAWRNQVKLVSTRARAQFDKDLDGLIARMRSYLQNFQRSSDGGVVAPDVSGWGKPQFDEFYDFVEGPIFFYDRKDWLDSPWVVEGWSGPPGGRPDLLETWMLLAQLQILAEDELALIETFFGSLEVNLKAIRADLEYVWSEGADNVIEMLSDAAKSAGAFIKKTTAKAGGFLLSQPIVLVLVGLFTVRALKK